MAQLNLPTGQVISLNCSPEWSPPSMSSLARKPSARVRRDRHPPS